MRIYRASGLGGCVKAQVAGALEFVPLDTSKQMAGYAHEGELHEVDVLGRLGTVTERQKEVTLALLPSVSVVGHVDGMIGPDVVEVKSMGAEPYKAWMKTKWETPGLVQRYKWQISAYMLATGGRCLFVAKNRNTGDIDEHWVTDPFYSKADILRRVLEIEKWVRMGELPDQCDVRMYPCPFYYLEQQANLELTEDAVLDQLARIYEQAGQEVKRAENKKKEARRALDTGMAGRDKVVTESAKVTYYESKSEKVDVKKMKEDGIDVDKYKVQVIGRRLRVTVNERERAGPDPAAPKDEPRGDGEREATDRAVMDADGKD